MFSRESRRDCPRGRRRRASVLVQAWAEPCWAQAQLQSSAHLHHKPQSQNTHICIHHFTLFHSRANSRRTKAKYANADSPRIAGEAVAGSETRCGLLLRPRSFVSAASAPELCEAAFSLIWARFSSGKGPAGEPSEALNAGPSSAPLSPLVCEKWDIPRLNWASEKWQR